MVCDRRGDLQVAPSPAFIAPGMAGVPPALRAWDRGRPARIHLPPAFRPAVPARVSPCSSVSPRASVKFFLDNAGAFHILVAWQSHMKEQAGEDSPARAALREEDRPHGHDYGSGLGRHRQ